MSSSTLPLPAKDPLLNDPLNFQSAEGDVSAREEGDVVVYQFRNKTFRLDKSKARQRLAGKKVINGHRSAELNVLPLKYHEAYRIYKQMKANHWEPDVIDMSKDAHQWNTNALCATSPRNPFIWTRFCTLLAASTLIWTR